jgi:hypothetical protein
LEHLAHNLKIRKFIENGILSVVKQWKKLTSSTSFDHELQKLSHQKAAQYALKEFSNASYFPTKSQLYDFIRTSILTNTDVQSLHAEFGVFKGESLNFFATANNEIKWFGFDSFEGLPENWNGHGKTKAHFSTLGKLPKVKANVTLVPGLFENTLPQWIRTQNKNFAFVHLDADLYSSTKQVLTIADAYFPNNTLFLFDEYFGYVGWEQGEHKAWIEWLNLNQYSAECIAYAGNGTALFRLKK